MASNDELRWPTLIAVTLAAKTFLDPVLAGSLVGNWEPSSWQWVGS
jgi:hypothetical protein